MNGLTISLKHFCLMVLTIGGAIGLFLSQYVNAPIELHGSVIGAVTSGKTQTTEMLSSDELAVLLERHQPDGSIIDQIVELKTAEIRLSEEKVEPSRFVPLIGQAELHRVYFVCDIVCKLRDGAEHRVKIKAEKNHFHLVGNSKQ